MQTGFMLGMIVWLAMLVGSIVSVVIFLMAVWRAMRAHESIARSLQRLARARERAVQTETKQ